MTKDWYLSMAIQCSISALASVALVLVDIKFSKTPRNRWHILLVSLAVAVTLVAWGLSIKAILYESSKWIELATLSCLDVTVLALVAYYGIWLKKFLKTREANKFFQIVRYFAAVALLNGVLILLILFKLTASLISLIFQHR